MAAIYNALEEFVMQMAEEDPHFVVFPYNFSDYKSMDDLLPPIKTMDDLLDDINEWLMYFSQAKSRISGGDTYMALLMGLSIPLPKLIKNLSTWMLLFSTQSMDVELLKEAISDAIKNTPVGLCWKTISQGSQGLIPN